MKILSLHGYKGYMYNSAYQALTEFGYEVIAPDIRYDEKSPRCILNELSQLYSEELCDAVVGTSLGGFFAAQLCVEKCCRAVFINPCLIPFVYLPKLGYNNQTGIREFSELFSNITKLDKKLISTILGAEDEIIDTHDYTKTMLENSRFFIVPGGMHSGATLHLDEMFRNHSADFFGI